MCWSQRLPFIPYISQEQIKEIGETVELECSTQYTQRYSVVWVKTERDPADLIVLSAGTSLVI